MKYRLVTLLLVVFTPMVSLAQKDIFWADGGISLARFIPGASVTYNYKVLRHLGLGAGAQLYDFHATRVNFQPVPALFWDVRANFILRNKSELLWFFDAGINIYKDNGGYWSEGNNRYTLKDDNGSYTGIGLGYFHPQTARGWGHYVTLKLISNHYSAKVYNVVSGDEGTEIQSDATLVISFGYKF